MSVKHTDFVTAAGQCQRLIAYLMTQVDGFKAEAMLMRHFLTLKDHMEAVEAGGGPADTVEGLTVLIDVLRGTMADYDKALAISEMWRRDNQARNETLVMERLNAYRTERFDLICRMWCEAFGHSPEQYEADSWGNAPDSWLEAAIKGIRPYD